MLLCTQQSHMCACASMHLPPPAVVLDEVLPQFCERGITPQKVMVVLQKEGNAAFFQALLGECWPTWGVQPGAAGRCEGCCSLRLPAFGNLLEGPQGALASRYSLRVGRDQSYCMYYLPAG